MDFKQQQKNITKLQERINSLVDELRTTQIEIKAFKEAVARDMKAMFEHIKDN